MTVEKVWLAPFNPEEDAGLLAAWVKAPHVARWWGDSDTQLKAVIERPAGGGDALIVADGIAVGYVRWQEAARAELEAAGLSEIPDGTMDIDIAIGEADYIGLGIASRALKRVIEDLVPDKSIPLIMMATSVENTRAIKAYEKAGLRRSRRFQDPEYGEMWLFTLDPSAV